MLAPVAAAVLTAFVAVVVLVTRVRLAGRPGTRSWLLLHTVTGLVGTLVWAVFLAFPADSAPGSAGVGIVGLGCYWFTALAGLALLARWRRPEVGRRVARHAAGQESRALSRVGHVGTVLAVTALTVAYALALV
ncbi:hypothetical protein [Nocardioides bruguierae]|uniref:Uncharacterized protein n=1 Tax=Nocardioides bruguierae TaxID=2945102 RepID=A0A9X2D862_9ACTN|nr:hypothetical protein [Nocardioides bruguierae]MCM0620552.1 hypothetical protein [Nocardioides bruguierae]